MRRDCRHDASGGKEWERGRCARPSGCECARKWNRGLSYLEYVVLASRTSLWLFPMRGGERPLSSLASLHSICSGDLTTTPPPGAVTAGGSFPVTERDAVFTKSVGTGPPACAASPMTGPLPPGTRPMELVGLLSPTLPFLPPCRLVSRRLFRESSVLEISVEFDSGHGAGGGEGGDQRV